MKLLPVKRIGKLVDLFVEACEKAPAAEVLIEIDGSYGLDKEGEIALAALVESDLGLEVPAEASVTASTGRRWDNTGLGTFKMRLHRPSEET